VGVTSSRSKRDAGRDSGGFVALPWSVLDCAAYARLSHPARGLLFEFARQFVRDNNGRLLASGAYLAKRGWKSVDVITRAKRELLEADFIFETVKGQRPNKASWYAVTWRALDKCTGYDFGTEVAFERGAYLKSVPQKITPLTPPHGVERPPIAPPHGVERPSPTPSHGAISPLLGHPSTPSHGDHLEMPSASEIRTPDAVMPQSTQKKLASMPLAGRATTKSVVADDQLTGVAPSFDRLQTKLGGIGNQPNLRRANHE
jgi:hypothetical protein